MIAELPAFFWPIPRDLLQATNRDADQLHRLRSLVAYQVLFGGKLVIRDSDYLNCLALRRSIITTVGGAGSADEQFFRAALDLGLIEIAFRQEQSLSDTATRLGQRGGAPEIGAALYSPLAPDVHYISSHVQPKASFLFSVRNAARYYTEQTTRILARPLGGELPDALRLALLERLREAASRGSIAWEFLAPDGAIWAGLPEADRARHSDYLYRIVGQAAHTGFIPDSCDIEPIYMSDVAKCIELWRGRHLLDQKVVDELSFDLGKGFSFSDYVECLCRLPVDAVIELATSDEHMGFQYATTQFAKGKYKLAWLRERYRDYRKLIDARILSISRVSTMSGGTVHIKALVSENAEDSFVECVSMGVQEVTAHSVPFLGLAYKVVKRVATGEWPTQRAQRLAIEETAATASEDIHALQERGTRITGKLIGDSSGRVDRELAWERAAEGDICVDSR